MEQVKSEMVWMLTDGMYSDYRVMGIYSTEERAKTVQGLLGGDIEEMRLDPGSKELSSGLWQWRVLMLRDGTTEKVWRQEKLTAFSLNANNAIWERTKAPAYRDRGIPDVMDATVWAKDEKHAVKIVNEYRTQWISDGRWK